jgi:hypothetical protein
MVVGMKLFHPLCFSLNSPGPLHKAHASPIAKPALILMILLDILAILIIQVRSS